MNRSVRQIYGIRVRCAADPRAVPVLDAFFGPARDPGQDGRGPAGAPVLALTVTVVDDRADPGVEPPHTEEVIAADPIVIDTGRSRCVFDVDAGTADLTLAVDDLADPVVWGRWILERLALYLVCRSPRLYPLHAGGFRLNGHDILVSGPTGMGKSTFTHHALRRGAEVAGEDIMVRDLRDERPGRVWGYTGALYLTPDRLTASGELAGAERAAVNDAEKLRVTVPAALRPRLRDALVPDHVVFLARGDATVRPLTVDEAVERCRDDISTGKRDPAVLAAVEADLRVLMRDRPIWELAMSSDLTASLDALLSALKTT